MNQPKRQKAEKRPRGRPKGTAPYAEQDHAVLTKFADQKLDVPSAKLTPFLKSKGYEEEKDIRRAQLRWRKEEKQFLRDAQHRKDLEPPDTLLDLVSHFIAAAGVLKEAALPGVRMMIASHERAKRRLRALEADGKDKMLPIDFEKTSTVEAAIERYEPKLFRTRADQLSEFDAPTVADLTISQRLYAAAMMLHEMSIVASENEDSEHKKMPNDQEDQL
ncbi:hypothetical protein CSC94_23315 [Zhengella mangrovi]|uniref:Uncharacterized protein n=1 Tax=Zhengella mangrovi TaxID=1982044 RepID=A0A2G1QGI0_9HYPH|nr:hypothetical protein [Zhengella mangrovi]PHP64632.1 hypothetical protein CSC94_23315 [Zhengella mangrovi]